MADYYFENGCLVLTEEFLRKRGKCCHNRCRHCPYKVDFDRTWYILKTGNDLVFDVRYNENIVLDGDKIPIQLLENKPLPIYVEIAETTYCVVSIERMLR